MNCSVNSPDHGNNAVDGINATDKRYFKRKMELIGKWWSYYTTNIGILLSASKHVSIKFADQCLHIIKNKEILNGTKGTTKIQKRESLFKYQ